MGQDIKEVVEESRRHCKVYPALNATFLTLIHKQENVDRPVGFRPIALCNVIYKILTTIMVNRLKPLLPLLISLEQSFVTGRQILDGIVTAQEAIHSLKSIKTKGMLKKIDLAKAYDRINWSYLNAILKAYGFDQRWVHWIHSFISNPNFSIMLNGRENFRGEF